MSINKAAIEKLKRILKVSESIKMEQMQKMLKLDEETFNEKILDWSEEFGFRIDGEYINNKNASVDDFIKKRETRFDLWEKHEIAEIGKLEDIVQKSVEKAEVFDKNRNNMNIETSAKTGMNVEKPLRELTRIITEDKRVEDIDLKKPFFMKSKVREYLKSQGFHTSSDFLDGTVLNDKIIEILDKAIVNTKADGRKTVKGRDIQKSVEKAGTFNERSNNQLKFNNSYAKISQPDIRTF